MGPFIKQEFLGIPSFNHYSTSIKKIDIYYHLTLLGIPMSIENTTRNSYVYREKKLDVKGIPRNIPTHNFSMSKSHVEIEIGPTSSHSSRDVGIRKFLGIPRNS